MIIKILDKSDVLIETRKGFFDEGRFTYKVGGFLGIGSTSKDMAINYDDTMTEGKERVALVKYDGTNYKQITLGRLQEHETRSVNEYAMQVKLAHLANKNMLDKPFGLKEIINIILLIILFVCIISLWYVGNISYQNQATALLPLNKTLSNTNKVLAIEVNQTQQLQRAYNLTIAYLQNRVAPSSTPGIKP